ncbi:flavodoxin [Kipferlia bialata]|uniref:Flavodoxin n=1 Tax=Kipferlia bialata TaxID=797122 RepID=A0A9K3CQM7_9EUKA|nr:flavodoxin [Kipferlia bialata]GIQ80565.1 flavodoxin [Kipferlia bialata]GIQ80660.1 flavodoxin [Kipferlia bialata]|eukprot:g166.t1
MMGALIKSYYAKKLGVAPSQIFSCSVMPCTAKKQEIARAQLSTDGVADIDAVITTRELGKLVRKHHIVFNQLPESKFDCPLGSGTGAAIIFGATGGVMEAALRTAYELASGTPLPVLNYAPVRGFDGIKEAMVEVPLPTGEKKTLRIAVASGIKYAQKLLDGIRAGEKEYHFVEVMACPGGCIGGGGQPRSLNPNILQKRTEAIYNIDERSTLRRSHENPDIAQLYKEFLEKPLSHKSHELLHTHYSDRSGIVFRPTEDEEDDSPSTNVEGTPLTIVYATQTGNSKEIAKRIASEAKNKDVEFAVTLKPIEKINPETLIKSGLLVYVTSTFGMGEHPDNAANFWEWLESSDHAENLFENTRVGVFGIGSSSYPMFCQAAIEVDDRMKALGAKSLVPLGMGDELHPEKYEGALGPWMEQLWDALGAADAGGCQIPEPKFTCVRTASMQMPPPPPPKFQYVRLSHSEKITPNGVPRDAYKFHFELENTTLTYETGFHISILARAPTDVVDTLCKRLSIDPEMVITVRGNGDTEVPPGLSRSLTVREVFGLYLDVCGPITKSFLKSLIPFTTDRSERERLLHLTAKEGKDEFAEQFVAESVRYHEVFDMFKSVSVSLDYLIEMIPGNNPRLYSIASSHMMHPEQIQLVIGIVDWKTAKGTMRYGQCTRYLKDLNVFENPMVAVQIKSSPLQPPSDPMVPITCVGLGSGIAPFRSFMQHREALYNRGIMQGKCTIYFGCRRRNEDALCIDEFEKWEKMGLCDYVTAFSREQAKKVYVTHRMRENPERVWNSLGAVDGFFGYCGPAGRTPEDIVSIIKDSMVTAGGLTADGAQKRYDELCDKGLVVIEAW